MKHTHAQEQGTHTREDRADICKRLNDTRGGGWVYRRGDTRGGGWYGCAVTGREVHVKTKEDSTI